MATERKSGAGSLASGVLERMTPHELEPVADHDDQAEVQEGKGRGVAREPRKVKASASGVVKTKARTLYLPEPLFERIMVQAHRKGKTISEYVTTILERQVPDYRVSRSDAGRDDEVA